MKNEQISEIISIIRTGFNATCINDDIHIHFSRTNKNYEMFLYIILSGNYYTNSSYLVSCQLHTYERYMSLDKDTVHNVNEKRHHQVL